MEMLDVMYELTNTKAALEAANKLIRKQKARMLGKNLVIAGLVWFGMKACKMLGEAEDKRREAVTANLKLEAELVRAEQTVEELNRKGAEMFWANVKDTDDKDICCDGKASITKKPQ